MVSRGFSMRYNWIFKQNETKISFIIFKNLLIPYRINIL
jgi:hypothetical protein